MERSDPSQTAQETLVYKKFPRIAFAASLATSFAALVPATGALFPATAAAQSPQLSLPDFRSLAHNASESVNINLGPWLLRMAGSLVDDKDPDAAATRKLLSGIDSIQVRSYEFNTDSAYSAADIETVRKQLEAPGWTPLLQSQDHQKGEKVDIYIMMDQDHTKGFALIASEPRQVTIINIAGSIDLKSLPTLERQLHLPPVKLPVADAAKPQGDAAEIL